jgi:hypothetical protein
MVRSPRRCRVHQVRIRIAPWISRQLLRIAQTPSVNENLGGINICVVDWCETLLPEIRIMMAKDIYA